MPMEQETPIQNNLFPKATQSMFIDVLFSSIGDGAIATDESGYINRVNAKALQILGFKEKDVLNKWFPTAVASLTEDGKPIPYIERPITQAFVTGHTVNHKSYYRHKSGRKIPVSVTVSPIILKGRPIGAINLFRDITQEYEVDRMKSEFISLASHQLRTPLAAIKTYAHMLQEGYLGKLNDDQNKMLLTIIESTNRMNQLTDTLLNITRIESGFMTIANKPFNIENLVQNIISSQALSAEEKNIKLSFKAQKNIPKVIADAFLTEEIITNLITNAIKYTPESGEVKVILKTKGLSLLCIVEDNGVGIPKQAQKQIFSKFYRGPNVVGDDTTGSGLGLYLVKEMADRMGAAIWFESEVNKGSRFYFSLPLKSTYKTSSKKGAKITLENPDNKI
jgi:PAS domain S-box-containing protein